MLDWYFLGMLRLYMLASNPKTHSFTALRALKETVFRDSVPATLQTKILNIATLIYNHPFLGLLFDVFQIWAFSEFECTILGHYLEKPRG